MKKTKVKKNYGARTLELKELGLTSISILLPLKQWEVLKKKAVSEGMELAPFIRKELLGEKYINIKTTISKAK